MKSSNEKLAMWLKENSSLLNMSAISKEAGIDRSNFNKYLDGLKIPDKYMPQLKAVIKKLEFKDELYLNQPKEKFSVKDLTNPTNEIKPEKPPKSNYVIDTTKKHKLWEEGDPKEGSAAFFLKYGCNSYSELEGMA